MKPMFLIGSVWLMFSCPKEVTTDQPFEEVNESGNKSDSSGIDWEYRSFKDDKATLRNNSTNRWSHPKMLTNTSSTLRFDEWWYYTTRRPIVSYKDFPGKPGVATWKEVSPGSPSDNRKTKHPTSNSRSHLSDLRHSMVYAIVGTLIGINYIRLFIIVL